MPRSVNAVASRRRRKKILKAARGYFGARSKVYTVAKNAVEKAMQYAYIGRKLKKRAFRRLWIARINAAARQEGMTYSFFMQRIVKTEGQNKSLVGTFYVVPTGLLCFIFIPLELKKLLGYSNFVHTGLTYIFDNSKIQTKKTDLVIY